MKAFYLAVAVLAACAFASEYQQSFKQAVEQSQKDGGRTWVVLIAGSTGWSNYRHQSSMYKAYQLAHDAGVPDSRIITFFQDDLADNAQNPFPGKVFNEIYVEGGNNINVYEGVVKDYLRKDATPKNLLNVLTGNPTTGGSGKILQSTAEDNVFIYYDDHGNSGIIAMPTGERFTEADLAQTFAVMTAKKMFKNMIFFMSACYSGSMFYKQDLPKNVYVATSAPTSTSSYACLRCNKLRTYVASCWPHGWINAVNVHGLDVDFGTIFAESWDYATNNSPTSPCQYGDTDLKQTSWLNFMKARDGHDISKMSASMPPVHDETATPQYLVPFVLAKWNYETDPTEENFAALKYESSVRLRIDNMVSQVVDASMPDNRFLGSPVCTKCDESCACYAKCIRTASAQHCTRYCCNYAACFGNKLQTDDEIDCALTLQAAFTDAVAPELADHDYIVSAGIQFNRMCRSGVNVATALQAINRICH